MKYLLIGQIFKKTEDDVAIKVTYSAETGKPTAKFKVSEGRKFGKTPENKYDFWDVTAFGSQAEFIEKNFYEGKSISVYGEAYHSKGKDGKIYLNLVVTEVDFVPQDRDKQTQAQPAQRQQASQQAQADPTQAIQQQPVQTQQTPQPAQVQQQVQAQQTQAQPVQTQVVQQTAPQPAQAPPQQSGGFAPPQGFDPFA